MSDQTGSRALSERHDLRRHSTGGLSWGYSGLGSAQLALALCADVLEDDEWALRLYQPIKLRLIACIETDEWSFAEEFLREIIDREKILWILTHSTQPARAVEALLRDARAAETSDDHPSR